MKNSYLAGALKASALAAAVMAAPAMAQDAEHDHTHGAALSASVTTPAQQAPGARAGKAAKAADSKTAGGADKGMMDMKAMCDMHKDMMSMHSPAERQALIDKNMAGMSADAKQKRMSMMDEHCK